MPLLAHRILPALLLAAACKFEPNETSIAQMNSILDMSTSLDMPQDQSAPDASNNPDMAADLAEDLSPDMNTPGDDMPEDAPADLADDGIDMTADLGGDMPSDMAEDMDTPDADMPQDMPSNDPYVGRPTGQCLTSADCGAEGTCTRTAPGGICAGPESVCDALPGSYSANFGACQRDCADSDDCPPGMACSQTRSVCIIQRCANNVCPTPLFGCAAPDGTCTRVDCSQGQSCPAGTSCTSGLCVEDRELN